jgi:hypothetical protein
VMSNHYHLVLYVNRERARKWSQRTVVEHGSNSSDYRRRCSAGAKECRLSASPRPEQSILASDTPHSAQ